MLTGAGTAGCSYLARPSPGGGVSPATMGGGGQESPPPSQKIFFPRGAGKGASNLGQYVSKKCPNLDISFVTSSWLRARAKYLSISDTHSMTV